LPWLGFFVRFLDKSGLVGIVLLTDFLNNNLTDKVYRGDLTEALQTSFIEKCPWQVSKKVSMKGTLAAGTH
jgi:hypothetical protein